jgi:hypothetical protein
MKLRVKLLFLLTTLASAVVAVAPAVADSPTELLPDLVQDQPAGLRIAGSGNAWRLAFDSTVRNTGDGPFKIQGHGGGAIDIPMVADQVVSLGDGSTTTYPGVGELHYVSGFGHEHWHLMRLEAYQLISVADPSNVVNDKKTGFCLIAGYPNNICDRNDPSATSIVEGLLPGQSDTYTAFVEYQELAITPSTTPAGQYNLVHTANPDGLFHEKTLANNSASLLLDIRWPVAGAAPAITCPDEPNDTCPGYLSPPSGGSGGAGAGGGTPSGGGNTTPASPPVAPTESSGQQPGQESPLQQPTDVPVVQDNVAIANALAKMTALQAAALAKHAIRATSKRRARAIATSCSRRSPSAFRCRVGWTQAGQRWRGQILVAYKTIATTERATYALSAANTKTGRRIRLSSATASSNLFASRAGAAMLCTVRAG